MAFLVVVVVVVVVVTDCCVLSCAFVQCAEVLRFLQYKVGTVNIARLQKVYALCVSCG